MGQEAISWYTDKNFPYIMLERFRKILPFSENPERRKARLLAQIEEFVIGGELGPREWCATLDPRDAADMERLFKDIKSSLEARATTRRQQACFSQLETLVKNGLEEKICEAKGISMIKKRAA